MSHLFVKNSDIPKKEVYMTLTQKERALLEDLKSQEELCIEKYGRYAMGAHDQELRELFTRLKENEQAHLRTINEILAGKEISSPSEMPSAVAAKLSCTPSSCTADEKAEDGYLCRDALSMEKHVSGNYNITVFEFSSPVLRDTLAHIEKEEQNHGEMLYNYLEANGMYA
jgi:spore coat protein CotF